MKYLKTKWSVLAPLETPLHADTIFGHICWALVYLEGEERLESFLKAYDTTPPLLISDGMPANHLPVPLLPASLPADGNFNLEQAIIRKASSKLRWLPEKAWLDIRNNVNSAVLAECLIAVDKERIARIKARKEQGDNSQQHALEVVSHNSIDRLTGRARKPGGFYQEEATFFSDDIVFDVFFVIDESVINLSTLQSIFKYIEHTGFGRNKSTGRGRFEIDIDDKDHHGFKGTESIYNAFMTLSSCCPVQTDPTEGFYDLTVKFGRLGGDLAKEGKPFKKAVTMLKAGSVFKVDGDIPSYCGQLLKNVHEEYECVRHYAYTMTYPITLTQERVSCLI